MTFSPTSYPALFRDKHGEIETTIFNDGSTLVIQLQGVTFASQLFDDYAPQGNYSAEQLQRFEIDQFKELTNYSLTTEMPLTVIYDHNHEDAVLKIYFRIGSRDEKTKLDAYEMKFTFCLDGDVFEVDTGGYFETGLEKIQTHYDGRLKFVNCFGCMYGDYGYAGNAMFGSMFCFKKNKKRYLELASKIDYEQLVSEGCISGMQEIFVCDEFEYRKKGVGYRG